MEDNELVRKLETELRGLRTENDELSDAAHRLRNELGSEAMIERMAICDYLQKVAKHAGECGSLAAQGVLTEVVNFISVGIHIARCQSCGEPLVRAGATHCPSCMTDASLYGDP